jgi:hypothetical protein
VAKQPDVDMQKINEFETLLHAFAERHGISYILPKQEKADMMREARRRREPIELIISERHRDVLSVISEMRAMMPATEREVPTLH